jgi:hypothetical protein
MNEFLLAVASCLQHDDAVDDEEEEDANELSISAD